MNRLRDTRPCYPTRACAVVLAAALLVLGAAAAGTVAAAPVRTLAVTGPRDGSLGFGQDLATLWRNRYEPTAEHLAVTVIPDTGRRLRSAARRRVDFAVLDAATAVGALEHHPRLSALAVLWANALHAVSRNPRVRELSTTPAVETWSLDSAAWLHRALRELNRSARARRRLHRLPDALLRDALDYAQEPLVLFAAPAPLLELSEALRADSRLRVLPVNTNLVDELKLHYPWLITHTLGRGSYPRLQRRLEVPAVAMLAVGRRDLPRATVRKLLRTVYRRSNALRMFNPLFGQTDARLNAVFAKLLPYHEATARAFGFTPSVP